MSCPRFLLALVVLIPLTGAHAQERDLRDRFGTRSMEAATQIQRARQLSQAKKDKEALAALDAAIKADGQCQMAHYLRGLTLGNLGEIPQAIEAYQTSLSEGVARFPRISATAANNVAITLAKLKRYDESNRYFTRAILEDHANTFKQRGKAYRNLAISLRAQGRTLAAALAVAFAFADKAPNTTPKMVNEFFDQAEDQEAGRLLYFADEPARPAKRTQETKLTPVTPAKGVAEPVTELLVDAQGRYVVALGENQAHYHVIATADRPDVAKVELGGPLACACLADGHLYAVFRDPPRIDKLEVATGKVVGTYALKSQVPTSLVVFPAHSRAYYAAERQVYGLDLKTGAVTRTNIPGQVVAGHPGQRFVYSFLKPERRGGGGHIIVDGRPIFFRTHQFDWAQTTLFKCVAAGGDLLLAEARDNVASNAWRMSVSPDGQWVAVAGGGGWRPRDKASGGYGVAVFAAANLEHLQGFFATEAHPQGVCFNPVTAQVAVLSSGEARVYQLSDAKNSVKLKGDFSGPAAWSGNGRYLVLANGKGGGVSIYENALSPEEQKRAETWWKSVKAAAPAAPAAARAAFEPVPGYGRFSLGKPSRADLSAALARALASGQTDKPGRWQDYEPYVKDEGSRQAIQAAGAGTGRDDDIGIAIYQLRQALAARPESVPVRFFLAEVLRRGNQTEEAEKLYLAVVRADEGRTELSCLALNHLAAALAARDEGLSAIHCLAASLYLDRANPQTLDLLGPLLKAQRFDAEAAQLARLAAGIPAAASVGLPRLPPPQGSSKYSSEEIYRKAVWSVVLVKSGGSSGSGVCVGRPDIVVTNDHVLGGDGPIEVFAFGIKESNPVRLARVSATAIYRSAKHDLAVLKLEKAPDHLTPLAVAVDNPRGGVKVFAIGSPGLGEDVLEQSIHEGLVSAVRTIDGVTYVQHSAAVNPGNSGGPLLDEGCRVVGIATAKAPLEGVGFAIPAQTIRTVFKNP
jgi:S1-C subfamily serine protease/Tfp pilus assembly protein PilF